ncbi:MAG: 2-oxoacid:acceptor oxidoreductase family protein [Phycisphaerae bacterium]|nr:2-oxoacid:acceptor oxidoreductase family protein [Phycisphaerae bacterium]
MTEITLFGRGGQGGVTLAKLVATTYFLRGKYVQAFGVYAAERSGAPIQAYVRISDEEITVHNQVRAPKHIIVLDRTLIGPHMLAGLRTDGWVILNTSEAPEAYAEVFRGRRVATIDATRIAVENGLGTKTVPIVNTTLLGAVARVYGLEVTDIEAALEEMKFGGGNVPAAKTAFDQVRMVELPGQPIVPVAGEGDERVLSLLDERLVGDEPTIHTGSWASRVPDRHELEPPCNHSCPAGNDVQGFIQALAKDKVDEALAILLKTTPFPGTCGRVCPAPCMDACNRNEYDAGINVRELERYTADHGKLPLPTKPHRKQPIAVVGSGPAGLAATYHLARLGYPVTLFEAGGELGGVMRTGIPAYRLPREILDREISFILRHGVTVRTGARVDRQRLLGLTNEFAATFVATGLQELRALNLGNLEPEFVEQGIDFLDHVRRGERALRGLDVVVVGGGNTAMDAARSARRVGAASVRVVYRRTRKEMPAIAEEIDEALAEGIQLHELVLPLEVRRNGSKPLLVCQRMKLGEPDESGRARPVPDTGPDAQFDLPCDRVILALGQSHDLSILPEGAEMHSEDGSVLLGLSGSPVLAGGDFATNEGTVTAAVGNGKRAAWHIHRTLTGEDLFPPPAKPLAAPEEISMHVFSRVPREEGVEMPPELRRRSFAEVRLGLVDDPGHRPALVEANRCFSCGVCNQCDRCVSYCPEGVLVRDGVGQYRFDYDYCKGCGVCSSQCPRGVIFMKDL